LFDWPKWIAEVMSTSMRGAIAHVPAPAYHLPLTSKSLAPVHAWKRPESRTRFPLHSAGTTMSREMARMPALPCAQGPGTFVTPPNENPSAEVLQVPLNPIVAIGAGTCRSQLVPRTPVIGVVPPLTLTCTVCDPGGSLDVTSNPMIAAEVGPATLCPSMDTVPWARKTSGPVSAIQSSMRPAAQSAGTDTIEENPDPDPPTLNGNSGPKGISLPERWL
jgi:hypothetical protein